MLYDEALDGQLGTVDKTRILRLIQERVPGLQILHRREDLRPYECDGLAAYRTTPMLVALPDSVPQVQALMKLAHQERVPVVARGAGTGLSGGAMPLEKEIGRASCRERV